MLLSSALQHFERISEETFALSKDAITIPPYNYVYKKGKITATTWFYNLLFLDTSVYGFVFLLLVSKPKVKEAKSAVCTIHLIFCQKAKDGRWKHANDW